METVDIGYLEALGKLDKIAGAATTHLINNPEVRQRLADGTILKVQAGQALDVEAVLLLQPDLIFTSISVDPAFDLPSKLERSKLPVVLTAGYMETHPLARTEWIRFIAAFFEAEPAAEAEFQQIADRYETLVELARDREKTPTVFCAAPFSGVWHMPGGNSYTAQTIADAGGHYLWGDIQSAGSLPLDIERVFLRAANADIWINPSHYKSLDALFSVDPRFRRFKAARNGRVYNNTRLVGTQSGNPIWEKGVVRPDAVLADLIKIFHPDLLQDHEFMFYERLK